MDSFNGEIERFQARKKMLLGQLRTIQDMKEGVLAKQKAEFGSYLKRGENSITLSDRLLKGDYVELMLASSTLISDMKAVSQWDPRDSTPQGNTNNI